MGKVKKATNASSIGRSLVKDKSKRDRGKKKQDGWVIKYVPLLSAY